MNFSHFRHRRRWAVGILFFLIFIALAVHFEKASRFQREALTPKPGVLVLDCRDRMLRLGADDQGRRVILLPPDPLPETVVAAFLAAEDARFRQHHGVDVQAVIRAAWSNIKAGRIVSGASTITQQLARLAYPARRTFYHKLIEMLRSLRLEAALSKDEILRCYLNLAPQGNNLMGVETAARIYFGKTAAELPPAEAAVLAALAKAPGTLNPVGPQRQRLLNRRNWVLQRLAGLGWLSPQECAAARQTGLRLQAAKLFPFEAPHFVNLVLAAPDRADRQVVQTTLDLNLQRRTQAIVRSHRSRLAKCGVTQAAAVIIKNRTMEVAALAGSFQYTARDEGFNDGATSERSPGSALKPFLYAQALDLGYNPARILEDVDGRYRTSRGEFIPLNFDRVAQGPISMREALGNSLNLAAVRLLNEIGPPAFYDLLNRLQLINHPERSADYYGLGLVVGNPEVSLLQLAAAYACLANGGVYRPAQFIKDPATPAVRPEPVFSPQAAYIVSDILSDPLARARTFGASLAMNPPFPLAIKTGTSTRYRDCWVVGYAPEYTIAVWAGNFDGRPTAGMSGASAAAPILADLAAAVFNPDRMSGFTPPTGTVRQEICSFSGMQPGPHCRHRRQEIFIAGTEPADVCTYHHRQEPWHRMPTEFAGWLHDRYEHQGTGRFRLAGFDHDLTRIFGVRDDDSNHPTQLSPAPPQSHTRQGRNPTAAPAAHLPAADSRLPDHGSRAAKLSFGQNPTVHLHNTLFRALAAHQAPQVTIAAPLNGDRFLMSPGQEAVTIALRAVCRSPLPRVTWFVDGREFAATGPPYELSLPLGRGHHRLTVVGPDGLGDNLEIAVE